MTTDDPARLITEADRQRALTVLRRAAEDGRLTPTALDERSRRVREVLLVGQLDDVLEGLRPTRDTDLLWPNSERATASPPARTSASQPALPVPAGHRADDRLVLGGGMASDKRAGVWVLPPYLRVLPRVGSIRLDCRRAHAETAVIDLEVGIGAGSDCDAQVLVWQDMAGLRTGKLPRFVKQYADMHGLLQKAAREFAAEVGAGTFPGPEHTF